MHTKNLAIISAAVTLSLTVAGVPASASQAVSARIEDQRIVVEVAGQEFTSYLFDEAHKYPYFFPLVGPASDETLTTWDQQPFPHQSSLFFSLDRVASEHVASANYWQPRDRLETGHAISRQAEIVTQGDGYVILRDQVDWMVPQKGVQQLRDTRTVVIWAPSPTIRVMDFQIDIEATTDLVISPTIHSFFSVRMRPELAVGCEQRGAHWAAMGTGTLVDSLGGRGEAGTQGKTADWLAAYGQLKGHSEGLAIIQHSSNPMYPAQWVARDYGLFSPSSFAFGGNKNWQKGHQKSFRYRVVVFSGDPETADIDGWRTSFESMPATTQRAQASAY